MNSKSEKFIKQLELPGGNTFSVIDQGGVLWLKTDPSDVPQLCVSALSLGAIFDAAFIFPVEKQQFRVTYILRVPQIEQFLVVYATGTEFYSISAKLNVASWDERKMQDSSGLLFKGMADTRPLLFHPDGGLEGSGKHSKGAQKYTYPIAGTGAEGEFQIAVGPVHAGIIEPGHFRFHVVGETINKLETRMAYLHRGVESVLEKKDIFEAIPLVEQISGDEAVANTLAYC